MKDNQIEEMAKALTRYEYSLCERLPKDKCLLTSAVHAQVSCDYCKIAEFLVNEGYLKASDVAREIFAEIEEGVKAAVSALQFENNPIHRQVKHETHSSLMRFIKTVEKKYTEEK